MVEHNSVFNLLKNMMNLHKLSEKKVVAVYSNYVFDAFICELFPPLINGNQLILLSDEERLSLDQLLEAILKHNVNLAFIPSLLVGDFLNIIKDKASKLKMIFAGGDKLANIEFERIPQDLTIVNEYGPTEATVCSTLNYISPEDAITTIGKPLMNTGIYILDPELQLLPIGAVGEIYITGEGLARGYLNQPELTSEKFILNPYQTDDDKKQGKNARLYKTGDMAKYLPDGRLIFIGRNDSQIKINGHRIELSEIENTVIRVCNNIRQAVAIIKNDNRQMPQIIVYFVAEITLETDELSTILSKNLPDYMLPRFLIQLEEFRLNINGKIDYKLLPEPELFDTLDNYTAPSSSIEKQLSITFAEILKLDKEKVGVNDDFFRLGGNSILAIRLLARLNKELKVNLKLADILTNSCLGKLAKIINTTETAYQSLTRLNSAIDKPTMFMIHPGQAGCEVYAKLAKELENHYSCYGIDNYNLHHQEKVTDFKELAAMYLEFIINEGYIIDRDTPVTLLGWSLGGLIALEIATILEERGYQNINIFLLDTVIFDTKLCFYQKQSVTQKTNLERFLRSQSYDAKYVTKIIANYDSEIKLAESQISRKLVNARITLFKAMQQGNQFDGEINDSMIDYILSLDTNNVDKVITGSQQLQVIRLTNASHWNILQQFEVLTYLRV
jgi:acyl carrier protein